MLTSRASLSSDSTSSFLAGQIRYPRNGFQGSGARVDLDMPVETWNCLIVVQSAEPSLFLALSSYLESLIEVMIVTAQSVVPAIRDLVISCAQGSSESKKGKCPVLIRIAELSMTPLNP